MAQMKSSSMSRSNNYGSAEAQAQRATVLASCYIGPSGIPEVPSSGVPSPPSSPPLAAVNSASRQIAILPKPGRTQSSVGPSRSRDMRGGAALTIREDCERFFCETMATVFLGERNTAMPGSGLTSAHANANSAATTLAYSYLPTPPDDVPRHNYPQHHMDCYYGTQDGPVGAPAITPAVAWAEIWDFQGGASFRAFVADNNGVRTLFVFFHDSVIHLDLKPALMAIIELAEGPLACHDVVALIDKYTEPESAKALMRSLQWVGFELGTLEPWAKHVDVTSERWHTMSMEV
ncbi:hypothetical protein TD95_005162 [Thielaviopsis punctulata]|uniref:Ornithine decarboxylase antizyme n=1 Tax=Thielaviopsis punctulata TaxID=72032 RepID=A0A0F4ZJ87_9PEZI|nr:hypothetical protein TD95_005162 [Thielaviopsis punctulata]